jgi:adenine C2-methylase RlmN of 23S rRNA A2503 and tRNA A37
MPSITIRDLSKEAHEKLTKRARLRGQSLQQYLRMHLEQIAERPDNRELMEQIREGVKRSGARITGEQIVDAIHAGRAEREAQILSSLTRRSSSPP